MSLYHPCRAALKPFTPKSINFTNLLITTERDVEVLTAELHTSQNQLEHHLELIMNTNKHVLLEDIGANC